MTIPDETFSALEAEVAALIDVLLEAFSDPEAMEDGAIVADGLARFGERVERIGALAEAGGLGGLGRVCGLFLDQLRAIARLENPLEDRQRELLEEWPGLTVGYLGDPADAATRRSPGKPPVKSGLAHAAVRDDAARLSARLAAPWTADSEEGTTVILPEHAETTEPVIAWKETSERAAVRAARRRGPRLRNRRWRHLTAGKRKRGFHRNWSTPIDGFRRLLLANRPYRQNRPLRCCPENRIWRLKRPPPLISPPKRSARSHPNPA